VFAGRRAADKARKGGEMTGLHARRAADEARKAGAAASEHARRAADAVRSAANGAHHSLHRAGANAHERLRATGLDARARLAAARERVRAGCACLGQGVTRGLVVGLLLGLFVAWAKRDEWWPALSARLAVATHFDQLDARRFIDVPLYDKPVEALGFPLGTPWDGVRWQGEQPIVHVLGEWYILDSVEGIVVTDLVAAIRAAGDAGDDASAWQRRFEADLCRHLHPFLAGRRPDRAFDLVLRRGPRTTPFEVRDVPVTNPRSHDVEAGRTRKVAR